MPIEPGQWPEELREIRASFVTLHRNGDLRGCIGSLEAEHPLVRDVSLHAFGAAFRDPRFRAVRAEELESLDIHISVLTIPSPLRFSSESELLDLVRPGIDGLVLIEGTRRATFLPDVWEKLPDPRLFVSQLKIKAGLPPDHWSERMTAHRYTTESW